MNNLIILLVVALLILKNKEKFGRKVGETCSKSKGMRCNFGLKCHNGRCGSEKKQEKRGVAPSQTGGDSGSGDSGSGDSGSGDSGSGDSGSGDSGDGDSGDGEYDDGVDNNMIFLGIGGAVVLMVIIIFMIR